MIWLPDMDLNHDKQIQSLLCYRYTIGQAARPKVNAFAPTVKPPAKTDVLMSASLARSIASSLGPACFPSPRPLGRRRTLASRRTNRPLSYC